MRMNKPPRERTVRSLLPVILMAFAFLYYGAYYRSGFNLMDDGSVLLLSQRLLEGERPIKDLMLGYNVLWFYPITGLFHLFGPSLVLARVWFFALATFTALFGYALVAKVSGNRWMAFVTGVLLVLFPGTTNKTYIPLMIVANMWLLVQFITSAPRTRARRSWAAIGGIAVGLSLLIRVDIGIFLTAIWIGIIVLRNLLPGVSRDGSGLVAGGLSFVMTVMLIHLPFYIDAHRRGFAKEFAGQYEGYISFFSRTIGTSLIPERSEPHTLRTADSPAESSVSSGQIVSRKNMARKPVSDLWTKKKFRHWGMAFLTYAPVVSVALVLGWAVLRFLTDLTPKAWQQFLIVLAVIGSALTAFAQFFSFRPDVAHLSEFMTGFIAAVACASSMLWQQLRNASGLACRISAAVILFFLCVNVAIYVPYALGRASAGTIAARKERTLEFRAANGVDIYVTPEELQALEGIARVVREHARERDYVVAYPYVPGVNFMTNRPTYESTLFIDNVFHPKDWPEEAIERVRKYKPAVIVINNWAMHRNPESRFQNWARPMYEHVRKNYRHAGTFGGNEMYVRPDNR
jgi:hypothetical protein